MACCIFLAAMIAFLRDPRAMTRRSSLLMRCLVLLLGAALGAAVYVDVSLIGARVATTAALAGGVLLAATFGAALGRVVRSQEAARVAVGCIWGWLLLSLAQMHLLHAGPTWTSLPADLAWHAAGALFGAVLWAVSIAVSMARLHVTPLSRPSSARVIATRSVGRTVV